METQEKIESLEVNERIVESNEDPLSKTELALRKMSEGYNCAQSVVAAFAKDVGSDMSTALKTAGVFGGGLAHHGHVCGAVSGALMIIGMKYNGVGTDYTSREYAFLIGSALIEEFETRHQTIDCRQLTGCDISTSEGLKKFKDSGIYNNVCPQWIKEAAEILETLL